MIVTSPGDTRTLDTGSFTDLTSKECIAVGYDARGMPFAQFAVNLTADEVAAVQQRLAVGNDNEEVIRGRARAAWADLAAYEALPSPTSAQTTAAVRLLCRVARALIRLQLRSLDDTT